MNAIQMKLLELKLLGILSVAYDLGMLLLFGGVLCLLLRRRDLWLRYTAAEEAFWLRLHLPSRFVAANRRFSEGRAAVYFVVVCLVISLLFLITSVGLCIYINERQQHLQPKSLQPTRDGRSSSASRFMVFGPAWLDR
jgi:hypothetical protein